MAITRQFAHRITRFVPLIAIALILSACGEGESNTTDSPATSSQTVSGVPNTNTAPTISGVPSTSAQSGEIYTFTPTVSDQNGDTLTFSVTNKPTWANFTTSTGTLSGAPGDADVGDTADITIAVSDGQATASVGPFKIHVNPKNTTPPPSNHAPTISGTPASAVVSGQAYSFTPTAADADFDALSFLIVNKPAWASFNTSTGVLSGTPSAAQVGAYVNITISVSDGKATVSLPAFTIQVTAVNRAPVISGTAAASVQVGQAYSFIPAASDPDGNALTFSITNKPAWAAFSTTTGALSGTPSSAYVGMTNGIVITVSDGKLSAPLAAFSIQVTTAVVTNHPPTISGAPSSSVNAGTAYSFVPAASDADGDAFTFSIQNKPSWASFSTMTGALTGTPSVSDVNTYPSIVISVSDGKASAPLAAFSIIVSSTSSGAVTLLWVAPTQNTDGSTLTDLSGYKIHYGTNSSALSQTVTLNNPGLTTYVISNLSPGTYYFAMTSLNSSGIESDASVQVSKVVN